MLSPGSVLCHVGFPEIASIFVNGPFIILILIIQFGCDIWFLPEPRPTEEAKSFIENERGDMRFVLRRMKKVWNNFHEEWKRELTKDLRDCWVVLRKSPSWGWKLPLYRIRESSWLVWFIVRILPKAKWAQSTDKD